MLSGKNVQVNSKYSKCSTDHASLLGTQLQAELDNQTAHQLLIDNHHNISLAEAKDDCTAERRI
jgi:hypothetical protein